MPTEKSARRKQEDEIWADDAFGRREDAEFLQRFLVERTRERKRVGLPASYVLNLDARWGSGKSFFLDRFGRALEQQGYLVARVNAWEDDHADDPLLPVMAAVEHALGATLKRSEAGRKLWKTVKSNAASIIVAAAKGSAKHWAKKIIGEGVDEIVDIAEVDAAAGAVAGATEGVGHLLDKTAEELLRKFADTKKSIAGFKKELSRLLNASESAGSSKLPLFVLVDELDRCRPTYAITLLERIKHLFEIDGVVFVIATDTSQLEHSICAVYGQGFDAEKYLYRFFERTYLFDQPSRDAFVSALLARAPVDQTKLSLPPKVTLADYVTDCFDYFNLPLRDCEQCFDIFMSAVTAWDIAYPMEVSAMLPLVIAFQQQKDLSVPDFAATLQKLAAGHGGGTADWAYSFAGFRTMDGVVHADERVSGFILAALFRIVADKPLERMLEERDDASAGTMWVRAQLAKEGDFLRKLPAQRDKKYSMVRDFPRMVRSAGRVKPI